MFFVCVRLFVPIIQKPHKSRALAWQKLSSTPFGCETRSRSQNRVNNNKKMVNPKEIKNVARFARKMCNLVSSS